MEFNCSNTHIEDSSYPIDPLVDSNNIDFHHLFYESNASFLDVNCMQPHSNKSSLLSDKDINASSVDEFYLNVGLQMYNRSNQVAMEHLHLNPHFSANYLHGIETHKSFLLNNDLNFASAESDECNDQCTNMDSELKPTNKTNVVKGQWLPEEDRLLIELVEQHGTKKWSFIAQMLHGRVGKQCRERWHNHLRPGIKKDAWSIEEDKILIEGHAAVGNKWAEIAKHLPGRTENSIKNRWNATKRKHISRSNGKRRSKCPTTNGSLLQDYIKTLTQASLTTTTSMLTTEDKTNSSTQASNDSECYFPSDDNRSMPELYNFQMAMDWDVTVPSLILPSEKDTVSREMDLVEMILNNNTVLHTSF